MVGRRRGLGNRRLVIKNNENREEAVSRQRTIKVFRSEGKRSRSTFSNSKDSQIFKFHNNRERGQHALSDRRSSIEVRSYLCVFYSCLIREVGFGCLFRSRWDRECEQGASVRGEGGGGRDVRHLIEELGLLLPSCLWPLISSCQRTTVHSQRPVKH